MLDPATIEAAAIRFDQAAESVSVLGQRVDYLVDGSSWTCCAADRCREDAAEVGVTSSSLMGELRAIAADLRNAAAQRRAEIELAMALEAQVRAFLAGFDGGTATPLAGTAWSYGSLPPSGDLAWHNVARDLGMGC
jgi:hypothetical protein